MRAVIQRVRDASVSVNDAVTGAIDRGLLVYVGVEQGDQRDDAAYVASKVAGLRVFPDDAGRMNRSIETLEPASDERIGILAISQFTLHGDLRKGRRPSYNAAADPHRAEELYQAVIAELRAAGLAVAQGVFGAHMDVRYTNDGPVTLLLDSRKQF